MTRSPMTNTHHAKPWDWTLNQHQVHTLPSAQAARWLRVDDGCLWATRRDSHGQREDDIWLAAGESLALPAGSEWVLEAWPLARLSLLLQAPVAAGQAAGPGRDAAAERWWQRPAGWMRYSVMHA